MSTFSQYNFKGQKALIRVDFNVPLDKKTFAITDDTALLRLFPQLKRSWATAVV